MGTIFQSGGLTLPDGELPPVRLEAGGIALWPTRNDHIAAAATDAILGLTDPPSGAAVWFGQDLATLRTQRILILLQRIAVLSEDGGLLGNINVCENILLPMLERRACDAHILEADLEAVLTTPPWQEWFPRELLTRLPHELDDETRCLAGVLRAAISRPDAIVACNLFARLDPHERPCAEAAIRWLRARLNGCAWLFISAETALPAGFSTPSLGSAS